VGYREILNSLGAVMKELKVSNGKKPVTDRVVVFFGHALTPGSATTEEYNNYLAKDSFSAMAELNAELLTENYPKAQALELFGGVSFGGVLALRMPRFLEGKVVVKAINPDPVYGEASHGKGNWLKMVAGVAINAPDVITRREHYFSKRIIGREINEVLVNMKKRGIDVDLEDSPEQTDLKQRGRMEIIKNIARGADRFECGLVPPGVKVEWIQGAYDLSSQTIGQAALAIMRLVWPVTVVRDEAGRLDKIEIRLKKLSLLGLGVKTDESGMKREFYIRSNHPVDLHDVIRMARQVKCLFEPAALQS